MKDFVLKDWMLKVISFVIAVLLWFYVIAIINPQVDITVRSIPIRYTNQNMIEEKGLCLIADPDATVELKIRGNRKTVANIDSKNIYATVDLGNVEKTGTFSLPVAVSIPYEYDEIVSKKPYNASVVIDKVITAEKGIKVITSGNVANGYVAGEVKTNINTVRLSGASTLIDRIGRMGVDFNYEERSGNITDTEKLYFIDKNGKRIDENDEIYDLVSAEVYTVEVSCPVYKAKSVPVKVSATAADGVEAYRISVQPSNVTIYAVNEILEATEEIQTVTVNLDNMEENTIVTKLVLPEGVKLRDGVNEVTIKAEKRN